MREILETRVTELERDLGKVKKKADNPETHSLDRISKLIEAEKIQASINNLYICLGRIGHPGNELTKNKVLALIDDEIKQLGSGDPEPGENEVTDTTRKNAMKAALRALKIRVSNEL